MKSKLFKIFLAVAGSTLILGGCNNNHSNSESKSSYSEINKTLTEIRVHDQKTEYTQGDEFVKPGVLAIYSDGSSVEIGDECTFTGFNSTLVGNQPIRVSYVYNGKTYNLTYNIFVNEKVLEITAIAIEGTPKTEYEYGEEFVKPVVKAFYNNETIVDISDEVTFEGFDSLEAGSQTVTVKYIKEDKTYTCTFTVVIAVPTKSLSSIEIQGTPKTSYAYNEEFEAPTIIAHFSDETQSDVTSQCVFSGFSSINSGNQTVSIEFKYNKITKTLSFDVTVAEAKTQLKFAIFADVQLCGETKTDSAAINLGETANAPLALKNHLEFCKSQGITTILMNGDVTNQANEAYYGFFESIVSSVYGSDKTKWPEFVWNMGNHEWWWGTTEKETGDAVSMFRSHARIESENLVAQSAVKYSINNNVTVPSYYKVINGIPFIVISAESSSGNVGTELESEIRSWIKEAQKLPTVKIGGPIFVEYHYPLSTSMTHGQASSYTCGTVEDIFRDVPNAVVFTGDTHYSGISERSINQVDFTTINIGSSSYSRMVDQSAVICNDYDNVVGNSSKTGDKMQGNLKFNSAYTPTIQIVEVSENASYKINKFFTKDGGLADPAGNQWTINPIKSKADFTYTDARFLNKSAALNTYGAEGLSWANGAQVVFGVNEEANQMTVRFPEVKEYHNCEHYRIKVNNQVFDEVSNYYKNLQTPEDNYYLLDGIETSASYSVEVTAYDFFDNPSLNKLTSTTNDESKCIDPIDYVATISYSDIQTRNRFDETSEGSHSSIEYYYQGREEYKYGAILTRTTQNWDEYLSVDNSDGQIPAFKASFKNLSSGDLTVGLSVVYTDGTTETWKDDFSATQKTVSGNEWTTIYWDLTPFKIRKKSNIAFITLKAKSSLATSTGYEMDFLVDDIDIVKVCPSEFILPRGTAFKLGSNVIIDLKNDDIRYVATDTMVIDFKFTTASDTYVRFMLGQGWNSYNGYFKLYANGTFHSTYNGVSVELLADGYYRVKFVLKNVTKVEDMPAPTEYINLFFMNQDHTAEGYVDINPEI